MSLFKRKKNSEITNKLEMDTYTSNNALPTQHTLLELAEQNHTYWKFSQSTPGLSAEPQIYAKYNEGSFTEAQDSEKLLSFVSDQSIARCYMYGDQLTKFCFNKKNPDFIKIQDLLIILVYLVQASCNIRTSVPVLFGR